MQTTQHNTASNASNKRATDVSCFLFVTAHRLTSSVAVYPPPPFSSSASSSSCAGSAAHLAQIVLVKGKWFESMGHRGSGGGQYLFVEEMLHLMEAGVIEVSYDGMPMSIEEGYAALHRTAIPHALVHPPSAYLAFSTLRNGGFILMRPALFDEMHPTPRAATAAAAAASSSVVPPYSVSHIPAPQSKKSARRRDAGKIAATPLSPEDAAREKERMRAMQSWLPSAGATGAAAAAASASTAASAISAASATLADPSAASSSAASALHALLSTPCDYFHVWLPPGHASNFGNSLVAAAAAAASSSSKSSTASHFKKSAPCLPDFLCAVTNPWLSFEQLWGARTAACTPDACAEFVKQRRKSAAGKPITPCVGELFHCHFTLSAEQGTPVPLRVAHAPLSQQRVFFVDWPDLSPTTPSYLASAHMHLPPIVRKHLDSIEPFSLFQ